MVVGDRGAALLPSLRRAVVVVVVLMGMHCNVESRERVRCKERTKKLHFRK